MQLIESLKFVQGAVAKRSTVSVLTHFSIRDGSVKGYNGAITLCSPIALDMDCQPQAIAFTKAIEACQETAQLAMTATGRLTVKSGKFKAHIDCSPEVFPDSVPTGDQYELKPGLIDALRVLEPMIAEDASKDWARSILIANRCLHATNNVLVAQYFADIPVPFPICISHAAVNELIRIKKDPIAFLTDGTHSITFLYETGQWLRTQLVTTQWPDITRIFGGYQQMNPIPAGFFEGLDTILPFVEADRNLFLTPGGLATHREENKGASVDLEVWGGHKGWYNIDLWRLVAGHAQLADFSLYPKPAQFFGLHDGTQYRLRGAIAVKTDGVPL